MNRIKKRYLFLFLPVIFGILLSFSMVKENEHVSKRSHNVCKKLVGNVLVYVVFVETKDSYGWDNFDINSTLDSLNKSLRWIEVQSEKANVGKLDFSVAYYRNDSSQYLYQNIKEGSVKRFLGKYGQEELDKWADRIVKKGYNLKNRAELISFLRNEYNVESVVLVFMINNYFKTDYSYTFNTESDDDVEYAVMSTKEPARMASEVMSLFGAHYLYHHPVVADKQNRLNLKKIFPFDIMANPSKDINELYVGEVTRYYIGWSNGINETYERMINNAKYKY